MTTIKITPASAVTAPTGEKSNIPKGSPSACSRKLAIMILGGVPIRVIMPPRIDAKDNGISVKATLRLAFFAACISIGINRASAATLFMTADSTAETPDITLICINRERPPSITWRAINSIAPELDSPRLTINTSAMMTVA
jgi:hypothetical protein